MAQTLQGGVGTVEVGAGWNGIVLIDTESQAKSNPAHIIGQMEIEPTRSLEQCLGVISNRFDRANNSEGHEGCEPIATPKVFKLFKVTNEMKIVSKVGAIHGYV